ncbi:30S ribosomal protein S4e [Candidatus Bathyarchaeota archaeon]|nr:MAG: 30S ribosomal protein S4e [Candidatus Bathyarchaeota archaeon]
MGRKGERSHLKRLASPAFWPIPRKQKVWVVKPSPGPHPVDRSIPLLIIVRDLLGLAQTEKEASIIISEGKVKVDGRIRKDKRFPVGLMDVVEILDVNKAYRVVPSTHRVFSFQPINEEEKMFKLCRIENKTTVKGGKFQLNLHDGKNILLRTEEPETNGYKTLDVIKINLQNNEIMEHFKLEKGMYAVIIGGKNIGRHGTITEIEENPYKKRRLKTVKIKGTDGMEYNTILDYVFVVGKENPVISLPGG